MNWKTKIGGPNQGCGWRVFFVPFQTIFFFYNGDIIRIP